MCLREKKKDFIFSTYMKKIVISCHCIWHNVVWLLLYSVADFYGIMLLVVIVLCH